MWIEKCCGDVGAKRLNRAGPEKKDGEENALCSGRNMQLRREEESMGREQSRLSRALFYAVLWAICCLLSHMSCTMNGWRKEEFNCLLMAQCALIYVFSSHNSSHITMMLWSGACCSTPKRPSPPTTGYNEWYCLRLLRCKSRGEGKGNETTMNNDDNYM